MSIDSRDLFVAVMYRFGERANVEGAYILGLYGEQREADEAVVAEEEMRPAQYEGATFRVDIAPGLKALHLSFEETKCAHSKDTSARLRGKKP